jgi:hypothetical protein
MSHITIMSTDGDKIILPKNAIGISVVEGSITVFNIHSPLEVFFSIDEQSLADLCGNLGVLCTAYDESKYTSEDFI